MALNSDETCYLTYTVDIYRVAQNWHKFLRLNFVKY